MRAGTRRDRTPEATPHGGSKPPENQEGAGAGTKTRRKRAPRQASRPTPRKGTPRRGDQRRPSPTKHPYTHHRSKHRTPCGSHQRTPTGHRNHTENGGHTYTGRTGHTHRGSRRAHHHALTARRRPRPPQRPPHRHRKRTKARPRHPRLGTKTPRGHGTKARAPREGNPTDGHANDLLDPPARAARPSPHNTDTESRPNLTAPPSHQPATLRPALRTTTQARLTSTDPERHHARPRHTAPPRATVQHATARRDATRHRAAQHDTTDPNLRD